MLTVIRTWLALYSSKQGQRVNQELRLHKPKKFASKPVWSGNRETPHWFVNSPSKRQSSSFWVRSQSFKHRQLSRVETWALKQLIISILEKYLSIGKRPVIQNRSLERVHFNKNINRPCKSYRTKSGQKLSNFVKSSSFLQSCFAWTSITEIWSRHKTADFSVSSWINTLSQRDLNVQTLLQELIWLHSSNS